VNEPIDLNRRRVEMANKASDVTPLMAMRETLRQMEAGEWSPSSIIIIGLIDYDDDDAVDVYNGGKASNNERVGMMFRASNMLINQ